VGPHTIPLTFGNTAGCHAAIDNQNACSQFDPGATLTTRIRNRPPPDNTHFVWLGGIASPSPTQFPGIYTATVIATVQYTGNEPRATASPPRAPLRRNRVAAGGDPPTAGWGAAAAGHRAVD